jgi:hypothetical protein
MFAILHALGMFVADLFKSRENLFLRHQLAIALRRAPVCTENLNPHVMVMKSAEDWVRFDISSPLNRA